MKERPLLPALLLIVAGLWLLVANSGFNLPGLGELWPLFIVWGGAAILWRSYQTEDPDPGRLFIGLTALGIGCFLLLFTLQILLPVFGRVAWWRMAELWPAFPIIVGLAWLGQFALTGLRDLLLLLLGCLAILGGGLAFAFTLDFLSLTLIGGLLIYWPVLLILIGLGLLGQYFLGRG